MRVQKSFESKKTLVQTPSKHSQVPSIHIMRGFIPLEVTVYKFWVTRRVGGENRYIIMPLRGPTCKIARFQAELKFPSWTECAILFMLLTIFQCRTCDCHQLCNLQYKWRESYIITWKYYDLIQEIQIYGTIRKSSLLIQHSIWRC